MSALADFRVGLESLALDPDDRPFLCSGSPLECRAFVVGFNPATTVPGGFWQFWSDETGYDREAFMRAYLATRSLRGGRPRIEAISGALPKAACLETNILSLPTAKASDLAASRKTTAVFEYLFDKVRPQIVFLHSNGPIAYLERATGSAATSEPRRANWRGHEFMLVGRPGPLWRAKIDDAKALGTRMATLLS